jgi:hypothetical protein
VQHCDGVVAAALLLCRRCESDDGLGGVDPKLSRGDAGVCRDRRAQQTPRRSKRKRRRASVGCRSGTRRSSDSPSGGRHGCIGESAPVGHREADDPGLRNRVKARADESRAKVENSVALAAPAFPETKRPDLSAPHSLLARAFAQKEVPAADGATSDALPGIASARLSGVRVVALDDDGQRRPGLLDPRNAEVRWPGLPTTAEHTLATGSRAKQPGGRREWYRRDPAAECAGIALLQWSSRSRRPEAGPTLASAGPRRDHAGGGLPRRQGDRPVRGALRSSATSRQPAEPEVRVARRMQMSGCASCLMAGRGATTVCGRLSVGSLGGDRQSCLESWRGRAARGSPPPTPD